jgi:hypothetical protein
LRADTDGKFVKHISQRLDRAHQGIVAARKNLNESDNEAATDDAIDCEYAICTVRLLQLLCESEFPVLGLL